MWKVPATVMGSALVAVFAAIAAPVAFAIPAVYPAQAPTDTPNPHVSASAMDPNMPGMDPNMPGMDHGSSATQDGGPASSHHSNPGAEVTDSSRPQAAVVGTFVALNGGVLLTAGLLRRRAKLLAAKKPRTSRTAK